jgi:Lon protease-like protein
MSRLTQFLTDDELPQVISFISASGVVLLPGGLLPYHAQKASEIKAIDQALNHKRYIGIVQPKSKEGEKQILFRTGCLGKITTFTEGADGTYFIIIQGMSSFSIQAENKKRKLQVNYLDTTLKGEPNTPLDRMKLLNLLKDYLNRNAISVNWDDVITASDESLVTSLAMMCPFNATEKQAILESQSLRERYHMLTAFMEISHLRKLENSTQLH